MEWKNCKIEDAPIAIIDGDCGKNYPKQGDFLNIGHCLFLNASNVTKKGFDFNNCQFISEDKDEKLRKGKLFQHDIVMTTRGTLGNVAYYHEKIGYEHIRINSGMVIFRCDRNKLLPNFFYLFICSPLFINQVNSLRSGVAQPQLPIKDIKTIKIKIPPLPIQQKIADILSKYDDLIENNRRRIELLERSARLLYKEWFVRLRFPGHEHTPIIDGIPEGWEKVKLQSIIKIFHGFAFRSEQFVEQKTNTIVVRMGNFKEEGGLKFEEKDNKYLIENSYNEKYLLKPRDLLMVLSDVTRDGRIIGNVGFVPNDNNLYVLNQRVARIEAPEDLKLYLYCSFGSSLYKNHCLSRANSVTVLNLKNDHIYEYQILIPDHQRLLIFSGIVKSIVNNIHVLEQQNQKLKQARDILLPKLMNGEIEV
ncbi:MAG: restriction endonuclease subunit S [Microcystis wesenbergii Mw_QC_S_20081001_S30D]|jgi:type I restriction enzyme S subunit|uniref:Restriction endonuclease subunit S n=1 Tax=Microcystis wesenbergii Mw_QC_S_20081001_S30D TaxID=2486245 RepID=A0A552JY17_9CHRO|nr:MAG: restriction endonuclease subunit S [Microcystis wesenbergii Mw_QC_S_20081001_S30]TRV00576.1 MAG: restriction endonuclease subunit S [Microcystis wesenbergii Mw_QC_S_20081001_S30D]